MDTVRKIERTRQTVLAGLSLLGYLLLFFLPILIWLVTEDQDLLRQLACAGCILGFPLVILLGFLPPGRVKAGKTEDGRRLLTEAALYRTLLNRACLRIAMYLSLLGCAGLLALLLRGEGAVRPCFWVLLLGSLAILIAEGRRFWPEGGAFCRREYRLWLRPAEETEAEFKINPDAGAWSFFLRFSFPEGERQAEIGQREARRVFPGKLYYLLLLRDRIAGRFEETDYALDGELERGLCLGEADREALLRAQEEMLERLRAGAQGQR